MKFLGKRKKKMDKLKLIKFNIVIFGMIAFVMLFSANAYAKNGFNKKPNSNVGYEKNKKVGLWLFNAETDIKFPTHGRLSASNAIR